MNINQISNPNFFANTKFIPLSKYKGPILQLTESDKRDIKNLQEQKCQLEIELYNLQKRIKCRHLSINMINRLGFLESCIKLLQKQIRQIKIDRLKQQKETIK